MNIPKSIGIPEDAVDKIAEPDKAMVGNYLHGLDVRVPTDPRNGRCRNPVNPYLESSLVQRMKNWKSGRKMIRIIGTVSMCDIRLVELRIVQREEWIRSKMLGTEGIRC
jgi:hypothetical protein